MKLRMRVSLISNPARKVGGVHVYVNTTGVGVEARMMFDGSAMIVANGKVLEQGAQLSLKDVVELTTATFDIEGVRVSDSVLAEMWDFFSFCFPVVLFIPGQHTSMFQYSGDNVNLINC